MGEFTAVVKIAAYQMSAEADIEENFNRIKTGIERAADEGAKLLVLPECALSGYPPLYYESPQDMDILRIIELNDEVCTLARKHNIWVTLGTITMGSDGLLNSALVISSDGEIISRYDKMHLMPDDKTFFQPGVGARVFNMSGLAAGALICYDARFPEPFRYLREQGAQLIIVISCVSGKETWKIPVLEGTYRTRASENSCFLVAVNTAGPMQAAESMIVNPLGLDLARAGLHNDEMIYAEINLSEADYGYFYDRRIDQFEVNALF